MYGWTDDEQTDGERRGREEERKRMMERKRETSQVL